MKKRNYFIIAAIALLCAVIAGALSLSRPRYHLTDIFEGDYRLSSTELEIEPITIDLAAYTSAKENSQGNADNLVYSGPHCEIRIDTIRKNRYGIYQVYFTIYNSLKEGLFYTSPERYFYGSTDVLQWELLGCVEVEGIDQWFPCSFIALGPNPPEEVAAYGIELNYPVIGTRSASSRRIPAQ